MRDRFLVLVGATILAVLAATPAAVGKPGDSKKGPKPPPDEEKAMVDEIREAYKAPLEVDKDVLKELRKAYQQPTPEREAKIFKELRRLYDITPEREAAILQEVRRAYERPSPEQEERIFQEIGKAERLPLGTVPASRQASHAQKLFEKFDHNGDGLLGTDELPDSLRDERGRWDANRDGHIDLAEYATYYQGRLLKLSEQVTTGQIEIKINGQPLVPPAPRKEEEPRPGVIRPGQLPQGLPDWFARMDADHDAQVGLYEWRKSGRPLREFFGMDRNDDGFITVEELTRYLALQTRDRPEGPPRALAPTVGPSGVR